MIRSKAGKELVQRRTDEMDKAIREMEMTEKGAVKGALRISPKDYVRKSPPMNIPHRMCVVCKESKRLRGGVVKAKRFHCAECAERKGLVQHERSMAEVKFDKDGNCVRVA